MNDDDEASALARQQELEQWSRWVQETLKADSEAFWKWCEQIDRYLEDLCPKA